MAQILNSDFPIVATATSGTQLADILNRFQAAQDSANSGAAAPAKVTAGTVWLDTSGGGDGVLRMRNQANTAWLIVQDFGAGKGFLPLTGGTLTGDLTISKAIPDLILNKAASGQQTNISFKTNGVFRWTITGSNSTAESGANAGSDFSIGSASDTGTGIGVKLFLERKANGAIYIGNNSKDNALSLTYGEYGGGAVQWEAAVRSTVGGAAFIADAKLDTINSASVIFKKNAVNRWSVFTSNAAETGSNTGSNFGIARCSDAGPQIDVPLSIARSTGIVSIKTSLAALELADDDGNTTGTIGDLLTALTARVVALELKGNP